MKRTDIFVINIILLFLTFGLGGLAVYHMIEDHEEPLFFVFMKESWKKEPIVDIKKVDIDQSCGTGYEPFANYVWPGTREACGCSNELYPQECRATQILKGCEPILEVSAQYLPNWQLGNTSFRLCKKQLKGFNFYDNFERFVSDCDTSTERLCHNKSYPVCIPKEYECPYNSISLGTITPNYFHNETIIINSDWIYYMARGDEAYSYLADTTIDEGAGVCKNLDIPNLSKGRENYILLKSEREYCRDLDTRFKLIGQVNEVSYFDVNGLLSKISSLIGYKIDESYIYGLYVRNLIPWKSECRTSILTDVKNLKKSFDDSHQLRIFEIVWLLIVFVSYVIWIAIDIFYGKTGSQEELLAQQLQLRLDRRNIKIFGFLVLSVQQFLCFVYHIILFTKLQTMSDSSCSDALTNSQINKTFTDYKNWTFSAYLTQFLFYLILIIIEFTVYFKIKKIAEMNAIQSLLRAKANLKNMTPQDEEFTPNSDPNQLAIIQEENDQQNDKPAQLVEFKMKRNVDKTKAKNPKVKKVSVVTENNKNSLDVSIHPETEQEIQLISTNNLNAPTGGQQLIISPNPDSHQSSQQKQNSAQQINKNPQIQTNQNDISINEIDVEENDPKNANSTNLIPQSSLKPNNRQFSNNQLLVSKNDLITSRNEFAPQGQNDDDEDEDDDDQNKDKLKIITTTQKPKKKKRVR